MKTTLRNLAGVALALAVMLWGGGAFAQSAVSPCVRTSTGCPSVSATNPLPVTVSGAGGGTVNQGNPNAGGILGWFMQLLDGSGNAITSTNGALNIQPEFAGVPAVAPSNGSGSIDSGTQRIVPASGSTINAGGLAASGASVSGNPVGQGCRAATAAPTAVADGQAVFNQCGVEGKQIILPYAIKELMVRGTATSTDTAAHTIIAAAGASIKIYVTAAQCFRDDAGLTLVHATLNDGASTVIPLPSGGGSVIPFPVPLVVAANTALQFTMNSAVTTAYCNAQGYTGP